MSDLHEIVLSDEIEKIKTYKGDDLDLFDNTGTTPLIYAIIMGCDDLVEALLKLGCDPNKEDTVGDTPLYFAQEDFDFPKIVKLLKDYGAKDT